MAIPKLSRLEMAALRTRAKSLMKEGMTPRKAMATALDEQISKGEETIKAMQPTRRDPANYRRETD